VTRHHRNPRPPVGDSDISAQSANPVRSTYVELCRYTRAPRRPDQQDLSRWPCSPPWLSTSCPSSRPTNQMSYDTAQFCNSSPAIVAGCGVAPLAFCLLPPLSPIPRAHCLPLLTLRDLRHLAIARLPPRSAGLGGCMYGRSWPPNSCSVKVVVGARFSPMTGAPRDGPGHAMGTQPDSSD
jgi:hypothetical protein